MMLHAIAPLAQVFADSSWGKLGTVFPTTFARARCTSFERAHSSWERPLRSASHRHALPRRPTQIQVGNARRFPNFPNLVFCNPISWHWQARGPPGGWEERRCSALPSHPRGLARASVAFRSRLPRPALDPNFERATTASSAKKTVAALTTITP